mgnify:FL=1
MPRIRLAFELIDQNAARQVEAERMKSVLESALKKGEEINNVKLSGNALADAISIGDQNKDKRI